MSFRLIRIAFDAHFIFIYLLENESSFENNRIIDFICFRSFLLSKWCMCATYVVALKAG